MADPAWNAFAGERAEPAAGWGPRGRVRAWSHGLQLEHGLAAQVAHWMARGEVPQGEVIKLGRVWRLDAWAIKLWPRAGRSLVRALGRSPAELHAERALAIGPEWTPQPAFSAESRRFGRARVSLLAMEFVPGRWLHRLEPAERAAFDAFPHFLSELHRRGIAHRDFNVRNALWTGSRWILIDLDAVEVGVRIPRKLAESQWARVLGALRLREPAHEMFAEYARTSRVLPDAAASWQRIEAQARRHIQAWDDARGLTSAASADRQRS